MTIDMRPVLEIASCSDAGQVRSHNEDAVLANPMLGLAVLADGMGGYNAGEVASSMATALLGSELERALGERPPGQRGVDGKPWVQTVLRTEIVRANQAIYEAAQRQPQYAGMGTTLVAALFWDRRVTVAHIGDSRLYRLRGEELRTLTRDHSLLQEQIDSGLITLEQARHSQNRNLVTRAMGVEPSVEPEVNEYDVAAGDIYLLCSDGLNDMVEDGEIAMTLGMLSANLELCASQLVQMANDNGGRDNISVILVKIGDNLPVARAIPAWWARVRAWFE